MKPDSVLAVDTISAHPAAGLSKLRKAISIIIEINLKVYNETDGPSTSVFFVILKLF